MIENIRTKGALLSASNCSGKTYLLKSIGEQTHLNKLLVFEMDSLLYFDGEVVERSLPTVKEWFVDWHANQDESVILEELRRNINLSPPEIQLIKFKILELVLHPKKFVTVLPQVMRHSDEGVRYVELLEIYFSIRLARIAIIPSAGRFALNVCARKKLLKLAYILRAILERKLLISKIDNYDYVVENGFHTESKKIFAEKLLVIFGIDQEGEENFEFSGSV